jgi:acetyl esterase
MSGPGPEADDGLHPEFAAMVRESRTQRVDVDAYTPLGLRRRKAARMASLGAGPEMAEVRDVSISARSHQIPGRIYVPRNFLSGVVVYYHGGGWVTGALDDYNVLCRTLAHACGAAVVSIDYRLAPEHPFPAAVDDALAGVRWVVRNLIEAGPVVLVGDSAGGNLAAVCARELTATGEVNIAMQVLVCPVLDHNFETGSYADYGVGYMLSRADMEWYWRQYVPDPAVRADPRASPLSEQSLNGLPRSLLVLAGFDPLRDEGLEYASRLKDAGVEVEVCVLDDVVHGFFPMVTQLQRADDAVQLIGTAVRKACRPAS